MDTDPSTPLSIDYIGGDFHDIDDKWQVQKSGVGYI